MNWDKAFERMRALADLEKNPKTGEPFWKYGQENSVRWVADQLGKTGRQGVLVADEVGMGKTRIVMGAILAVLEAGGTVAAVVPPGLLYQWKTEWNKFINSLDSAAYKDYSPVLLRSYKSLFENADLNFPISANKRKWLLISHQFGPPRLAYNSQSWRYLLPILVKALQQDKAGKHNNSHWQLVKETYGGEVKCIGADCDECETKVDCGSWFGMMNKAAHFLRKESRWQLFNDIPDKALESDKAAEKFKEWFNGNKGRSMLGELLGPIDLVIIDEAHKNRSEGSKLEVNLSKIIKRNPFTKHIAMTATPMELTTAQWKDLFSRIGESVAYPEKTIVEFDAAHSNANKYSNNMEKVQDLIQKSRCFREALKPFVTRRLRIKQAKMLDLLGLKPEDCSKCAHPHRDYSHPVKIDFTKIEEEWRPSIFALEAIGKAAKGCHTDNSELDQLLGRLKISDSRYAAGQLSDNETGSAAPDDDKLDSAISGYLSVNPEEELPPMHIQGKLRRIRYWRNILKDGETDLAGHPRIQRVANKIESVVWGKGGSLNGEKVLVFGTFNKPLHTLRDVLSNRAVLRFLDRWVPGDTSEPPIPAAESCLNNIDNIWKEYERISLNITISLKRTFSSKEQLQQALKNGKKVYEALRDRLSKHIGDDFAKELPGDAAAIGNEKQVAELLRSRLINELICTGEPISGLAPSTLKNKALHIWVNYLESYFDKEEDETENHTEKSEWTSPKWFSGDEELIRKLDKIADNVSPEELSDMVTNEMDYISGRLGFFARTLDGGVKMETRRVLQAQFNAKDSFPQVLIAQSQVGREGLNLHKACRTVIQFHSEWNPGVIEQQIGRVDRIDSFWEEKAKEYKDDRTGSKVTDDGFPKIDIRSVIFDGTYDHFQYNVSKQRRETLNAHLFGELLSEDALANMPKEGEWEGLRNRLKESSPEFSPPERTPLAGNGEI